MQRLIAIAAVLFASVPHADELAECRRLAPKYDAQTEVVLADGSRVDLLSKDYAIEVDWASKWAEAIGQSLHYAILTDRKPAIILLLRNPDTEWQHLVRAGVACGKVGIQLYVERVKETKSEQ